MDGAEIDFPGSCFCINNFIIISDFSIPISAGSNGTKISLEIPILTKLSDTPEQ